MNTIEFNKKSHVIIMVPKATGSEKCEKMSFCTTLKPYFSMGTGLYHYYIGNHSQYKLLS